MISLKKILNKVLVDLKNTFKKSDTIPVKNGGTIQKSIADVCSNFNRWTGNRITIVYLIA